MATLRREMQPMFDRIEHAGTEFIRNVQDAFGVSQADAEKVLKEFKKARLVKLNVAMGRYDLRHGAAWENDVIERAINM